jgi:hypothetical protein
VHDQFILVPLVMAVVHGLDGGHGFWEWDWWLRVDFLIVLWLGQPFTQVLGRRLMLLGLML